MRLCASVYCALVVLLAFNAGPSECLFSFFTNRESTSERPKLYLGPGNATVSSDLSVTLGCKANVAVKTCSWTFYPDSNPGQKRELTAFSPMSKHEKSKGKRSGDHDCSFELKKAKEWHSGKWICSALPAVGSNDFLVSKPGFLTIRDFGSEPPSTTSTTTTTSSPPAMSTREREPRISKSLSGGDAVIGDGLSVPHFVIERKGGSLDIAWILDKRLPLTDCIWITPQRKRISSGSNSVWVERSNSTCGIRIEERDDQELVGAWTVMAEVGGSREQDRIIRSTVAIPRRPPKPEETVAEEEKQFLGLDAASLRPYLVAFIVAGGVVVALVLVLACLVCHYRNRAKEKKDYECPQTASPSIVGISSKLPVKNEIMNETYAPAMYATVKRNSVKPSAGKDEKSHRVSVIGIEAPDLKADLEDDSISYLESTVHYSHILPAKDRAQQEEEEPEQPQMGDDFSPPGYLQAIVRAKTLPRPVKKASLGAGSDANEGYEVVVPSYENMGTKELEVLGFSSLRRYKVWPKESGGNTAVGSTNVTIGTDSEFPPPPVWPIN